jgi:chromosome partitioning protein
MTMARILAIANQKGGVGKTTTTVNLAAALAKLGQRVLLVDLDPQGNASTGSGLDKRSLPATVYQVLIGSVSANEAILPAGAGGYSVLAANRDLAGAELDLVDLDNRERRLALALSGVGDRFDQVVIDCPPSLSLLTLNGLCSASDVIIPMQCEYYALEGLSDLVNTLRKVRANFNSTLEILGLLRVMYDPRMALAQQVAAQLEQHFGPRVFASVIPRNVRLAEAPSHGQPGLIYDPGSRGAQAYLAFARELLERIAPSPNPSASRTTRGNPK